MDKEQREDFDIRLALVANGSTLAQAFPDRFLSDDGDGEVYDYSQVEWVSPTEGSTAEEFEETQKLLMAMVDNQRVGVGEMPEGESVQTDADREWV